MLTLALKGNGCSSAVEHTPFNREFMGLNPAGCRAFSLIYPNCCGFFIRSLVEVKHY